MRPRRRLRLFFYADAHRNASRRAFPRYSFLLLFSSLPFSLSSSSLFTSFYILHSPALSLSLSLILLTHRLAYRHCPFLSRPFFAASELRVGFACLSSQPLFLPLLLVLGGSGLLFVLKNILSFFLSSCWYSLFSFLSLITALLEGGVSMRIPLTSFFHPF